MSSWPRHLPEVLPDAGRLEENIMAMPASPRFGQVCVTLGPDPCLLISFISRVGFFLFCFVFLGVGLSDSQSFSALAPFKRLQLGVCQTWTTS